jgi:hypothetical protein
VRARTDSLVHQLRQLDPALRLRSPDDNAGIELRIRRILDSPVTDVTVLEPVHKPWKRPVVCGLASSCALALVAVLMWASPAQGSFSRPAAAQPASVHASRQVPGEGYVVDRNVALVANG